MLTFITSLMGDVIMIEILYVESAMTHDSNFVLDVPSGNEWLLVITKTPAIFWVDDKLQQYPAHSAIFYRPQQKVYYKASGDQFINDWILFRTNEHFIVDTPLVSATPFSVNDPAYCSKLIELLVIEHNYKYSYKESSISHLFKTLFNKLLESQQQTKLGPHYYNLLKLRNTIYNNPSEQWTIEKMASIVLLSPGYLQTIYKKTFGHSCIDDVIYSRIQLAKEYLLYSSYSIYDIAILCGYQNVEHFCRQFKKITRKSPKQFQKEQLTVKSNV